LHAVIESAVLERAEGDDLNLRLKIAFLPERVIPMPSFIKRKATSGPDSLTPRDLAYLKHKQTGLEDRSIAVLWDTTLENVKGTWRRIEKRLDTHTLEEALALTAQRLEQEAHALPLIGRMSKRNVRRPQVKWTDKLRRIVQGLADRTPRRQLATHMGIKEKTLEERIRRLKRALGLATIEELLNYARQEGVIDSNSPAPQ
jgi:DNA-binding CsgD family transcriptional regulator